LPASHAIGEPEGSPKVEEKTRIPVDISLDSDKDEDDLFAGTGVAG